MMSIPAISLGGYAPLPLQFLQSGSGLLRSLAFGFFIRFQAFFQFRNSSTQSLTVGVHLRIFRL